MQSVIKIVILFLSFVMLLVINNLLTVLQGKIETTISHTNYITKKNRIKIKTFKIFKNVLMISLAVLSVLIALPFNFNGELQLKYDGLINRVSDYLNTYIKKDDIYNQETEKSNEDKTIEPLKEFPFRVEYNVIYPETKEIKVPTPEESGTFSIEIPLDLRAEEYQSDKVPINADIHGFVVDNLYYCRDDDSVTDISGYNYYKFADYWFYLHTIDLSFMDFDGFELMFNGATIVLQEKETQKRIVLKEDYLNGDFVHFKCSTGQYIIEIQKEGIAYTANLNISKNEKTFLAISPDNYYYLSHNDEDSYIVYENNYNEQNTNEITSEKQDSYNKESNNGGEPEKRIDIDSANDNSQIHQYPDDYVINWEDETFGRLIKECLNKDQVTYADVKNIYSIEIFDDKIILNKEGEEEKLDYNSIYRKNSNSISLNDLKYFDSLILLAIYNFQSINCDIFEDDTFSSRLHGLYIFVELDTNQIEQISKLDNLHSLLIERNVLSTSDLETIATMIKLTELALWDDNITDITPLSDLKQLMYLDLSDNNITNIDALSDLEILETVILAGNNINDYLPVSHVKEVIKTYEEAQKYFNLSN